MKKAGVKIKAKQYEIIIPTDMMNPSWRTIGIELTIKEPKPTAVVAEHMKQGRISHLTACFTAPILLSDLWNWWYRITI
jgi:hypothetical protein